MANKVLTIGNVATSSKKEEVYVDIDINSKQNIDGTYRIAKSVNVRAVQNSLDNIFRWIPGERIINPTFGSKLREILHEGITDYNRERVVSEVKSSIMKWEPRVNITNITHIEKVDRAEDNTVELDIEYTINGLDNQVFHKQYQYDRNS